MVEFLKAKIADNGRCGKCRGKIENHGEALIEIAPGNFSMLITQVILICDKCK